MGISSAKSKTKTVNTPYAPAQAAIDGGIQSAQQVFNTQQPILNQNAALAQQAYQSLAPQVFQTSPYVADAQKTAQKFSSGAYFGQNPGAATYASLQAGAGNNPAMGALSHLSEGSVSPGSYDGIGANNPSLASLQAMTSQAANPADGQARATAGGQYLNAQPSAGFYADSLGGKYLNAQPSAQFYTDTLSGKYLNANPYLDAMVKQADDAATKAVNQRFAASGMGAGMSTPYADLLSRNLADSENTLRYGAYKDELARMSQVGGQSDAAWSNELNRMATVGAQSDAAWSGERSRMDAANGLLASDYNANADRALSAANSLGSQYNASGQLQLGAQQARDQAFASDRSAQLAAAQALGQQYNANDATRLSAAQAADGAQNQQAAQMLQALGMTGDLSNAQYAGVAPAISLLNTASQTPYYGLQAYAGALDNLAGRYGTSVGNSSQTPSTFKQIQNGLGFAAQIAGGFSDVRLKRDIRRVGRTDDGLGIYTYRFAGSDRAEMGVLAHEVAALRPDALGAPVAGFQTVHYGRL